MSKVVLAAVSDVPCLCVRLGIRKALLERGLVTWLVTEYLARREVRMYGLEYSTALLMNLCLHRAGKSQCVPIANNVLEILVKLLVQDLKQVPQPTHFSMPRKFEV